MPRTNSLSDSDGRSLTPDLEDEGYDPSSPVYGGPQANHITPFGGAHHAHAGQALTAVMSRKSHHTHHSRPVPNSAGTYAPSQWKHLTPKERFRAAARKVIAMKRGATLLGDVKGIGGEPGVDPRRETDNIIYGNVYKKCQIEIVDYSAVRYNCRQMGNEEFVDLMEDEAAWAPQPWVKCRWINIGGVSWDVIKALSLRYALHPLALGDVMQKDFRTRSKADYYTKHLFLRIISHELREDEEDEDQLPPVRTASPEPIEDDSINKEKLDDHANGQASLGKSDRSSLRRRPLLPRTLADVGSGRKNSGPSALTELLKKDAQRQAEKAQNKADQVVLEHLKKGDGRVSVKVKPLYLFLYREGVVITISRNDLHLTAPVAERLKHRDGVLRTSIDPSLLIHAILDITVDKALEVVDEYHRRIKSFERRILLRPNMKTVKELHILAGDLILHKRTLDPIKTMILGLRRYDIDRCAALIDMSDPANEGKKVVGYMSHKAKIYLADVYDVMDYSLTSLEMIANIGENLIDYTFNLASYDMNETMRRLTLATIIFLPLTLLTGYFGMNFDHMWAIHHDHTDLVFWIIALPLMVIVVPLFMWRDIQNLIYYIRKKMVSRTAGAKVLRAA